MRPGDQFMIPSVKPVDQFLTFWLRPDNKTMKSSMRLHYHFETLTETRGRPCEQFMTYWVATGNCIYDTTSEISWSIHDTISETIYNIYDTEWDQMVKLHRWHNGECDSGLSCSLRVRLIKPKTSKLASPLSKQH